MQTLKKLMDFRFLRALVAWFASTFKVLKILLRLYYALLFNDPLLLLLHTLW